MVQSQTAGSTIEERWNKFCCLIWDGPRDPKEAKSIRKLDWFLLSWAAYGGFIRVLDNTNITNAYISGMKEDLNFHGNQYNLQATFFTCGFAIGMIPSQFILISTRASIYLPTIELIWSIITFTFAAVSDVRHVYALRFLIGLFESPYMIGVFTLLGGWYTPRELAKRMAIFYSSSFAASMFSGYLQAGIYRGLDGVLGLEGWRWLFIICGCISVPGACWGFWAVPDTPHTTRARWMSPEDKSQYAARMDAVDREKPRKVTVARLRKLMTHWPIYIMPLTYIAHCIITQPMNYFAVWLKSTKRHSIYQNNLITTASPALGLVSTLAYCWISDAYNGRRWQIMIIPATLNLIGMVIAAIGPNYGATFFGFLINSATSGFVPLLWSWLHEFWGHDAEERAIVIAVSQTLGYVFIAWVPLLILDVGKYAPKFTMGFSVMSGVSVLHLSMIFVIRYLVSRDNHNKDQKIAQDIEVRNSGEVIEHLDKAAEKLGRPKMNMVCLRVPQCLSKPLGYCQS